MLFTILLTVWLKSKCCSDNEKHFNKELVMTKKKDDEDFEDSTKCSICDNDVIMVMMI